MKTTFLCLLLLSSTTFAQNLTGTRFFFKSLIDVSDGTQSIESALVGDSFPGGNSEYFRLRADYSFENITLGAEIPITDPTYLYFGGRYNFTAGDFRMAAGALAEYSNPFDNYKKYPFDNYPEYFISVFSAARYDVSKSIELCGFLELIGKEFFDEHEITMGFGGIFHITPGFNLIAEIKFPTNWQQSHMGGGFEYKLSDNLILKGGVLVPDFNKSAYKIIGGLSYIW